MTQILAEFVAPTFPALALAHFMALLSPGPDFFLVVGHAARRGLRGAAFICLGIALGNALYIALAVSGWSLIRQWPLLYRCMELAGAGYLCKRHITSFYRPRLKSCMLILQSRRCGYAVESQAKVEKGVLLAGAGSQVA